MRIAIVGGGISGLTAAWRLAPSHDVELFEAASELGGHTHTVTVTEGDRELAVDMGFIVYNERNYPRFSQLLAELDVASAESEMSFSVRCEQSGLEWNGASLNQLFAQRTNLLRLGFYRMVLDILRFHRRAPRLLEGDGALTFGQFLERERFRGPVVEHYLVPMTAAIWSAAAEQILDFPARPLASFLDNHGLLRLSGRPRWRFIRGGSRRYVEALRRRCPARFRLGQPVDWVRRGSDRVEVKPAGKEAEPFDHVVLATHSDQTLRLLADPTPAERSVLRALRYRDNEVVLHTDARFLPRRRRAWASWNYHLGTASAARAGGPQVTYHMNRLQRLDAERQYCVTLNRGDAIDPARVLRRTTMAHPIYDHDAIAAQSRWQEINGARTWFCGAYWGYGFHEDGVKSGERVARGVGERS